jgi:hypothetical protein
LGYLVGSVPKPEDIKHRELSIVETAEGEFQTFYRHTLMDVGPEECRYWLMTELAFLVKRAQFLGMSHEDIGEILEEVIQQPA